MNEQHPDGGEPQLAAIDFQSPGRFALHNPQSELPEPARQEPAPYKLGQEAELQRFTRPEQIRAHTLALLQQATRSVCLYSADFEPWLYSHSSMQQACTAFLLRHRNSRLRILLRDSHRATQEGHRLLALARRLSSHVQIRRCHVDYPVPANAFLLADDLGFVLRPQADELSGYAHYNDAPRVRQLQRLFDQSWDTSTTDADLRSFLL